MTRQYKQIPLEGDALLDAIDKLIEKEVPHTTVRNVKAGLWFVDNKLRIWDGKGKWRKGTTSPNLGGGGGRLVTSDKFNMKEMLNLFDDEVRPDDWMEILANWKELAKTDYVAAKALFETRFGKAPVRQHILLETSNTSNKLDTAYSRTKDKLKRLRKIEIDGPIPEEYIDVEHQVLDQSPYSEDPIRPVLRVRRKMARD